MTIYQRELLRQLPKFDCTGQMYNESGKLHISANGIPLGIAGKKNELYWNQDGQIRDSYRSTLASISDAANSIREYVSLYEASPPLGIVDLPEYRRLSEYGNTVLGAMYSEQHGFMFSTWHQNKERNYVIHGDYSADYAYAKKSFVIRSGLVDENLMITFEEAENLYRCIDYVRENCETLTYDQEQQLKELTRKLEYGYPRLEENPPSFEQDESPQMNM
ncbi:MAG: hypothetical protein NC215_06000 [Ruminococcus sp.]|nr:hypothetical protein [Ruminococcus sp.]